MFENISPVVLAVCGCSILCGGAFLMLGFGFVSRVGISTLPAIVTLISNLLSGRREAREMEADEDRPRRTRKIPGAADLREKSQSLDFDAAVQQYRQQQNPPNYAPPPQGQTPSVDLGQTTTPPRESRAGRMRDWRSRRDDDAEDELLGGLDAMDDN